MEWQHYLDISLGVIGCLGLFILNAIWVGMKKMNEKLDLLGEAHAGFAQWKRDQERRMDRAEKRLDRLQVKFEQ